MKNKKAQGSLELLILLGGAILIAGIIGLALKEIGTGASDDAQKQIKCVKLDCQSCAKTIDCAGYDKTGAWMFDGSATGSCNTTQLQNFDSCKTS